MSIKWMGVPMCMCALALFAACGAPGDSNAEKTLIIVSQLPPEGVIGANYGGTQGFSFEATGGAPPYTWDWIPAMGSSLPPGLDLSPGTGEVSGIPTAPGLYSALINIKDSSSPARHASMSCAITVIPPAALSVTSPNPPDAILGAPYGGQDGYALSASGGVAPYLWTWGAAEGSSLPPGLQLSSTGVISGTATTVGSYVFSVVLSDSGSPPVQSTSTYTIDEIQATGLTITSGTPPSGRVGVPYGGVHFVKEYPFPFSGFPLNATGGTSPYTWSWSAGAGSSLPPGLKVSIAFRGGSTRCCLSVPVIEGTPTKSGTYDVVLRVIDSATPAVTVTAAYTIDIQP